MIPSSLERARRVFRSPPHWRGPGGRPLSSNGFTWGDLRQRGLHPLEDKGVSFLENKNGWHGKALNKEQEEQSLKELGHVGSMTFPVQKPENLQLAPEPSKRLSVASKSKGDTDYATTRGDTIP